MNNRVKNLYIAILDNRMVVIDSSLSGFVSQMKAIEPGINSLSYYTKAFKKEDILFFTSRLRKTYTLQKYINPYYYFYEKP